MNTVRLAGNVTWQWEDREMLLIVSRVILRHFCSVNQKLQRLVLFCFNLFLFFVEAGAEVYFSPNNNFPKLSLIPVFTVTAFQSV